MASQEPSKGSLGPAIAVLVGVGAVVAYSRLVPSEAERLRGKPAPALDLAVVANGPVEAAADPSRVRLDDLKGKPAVLDFWASWCGPCKREAPILQALSERYAGRVRFVAVNTSDDRDGATSGAASFGIRFPVAYDSDRGAATRFSIQSLPSLVVLAKDGTIHAVRVGTTSERDLAALIDETL